MGMWGWGFFGCRPPLPRDPGEAVWESWTLCTPVPIVPFRTLRPAAWTPLIRAIVQAAPHRFPLCCAPSTMMHAPVTQLARSEAKKATTSATSSGVPIRSQGIVLSTAP
jgi:hypothetical protein